jgi:putative glutamine amidotransferase
MTIEPGEPRPTIGIICGRYTRDNSNTFAGIAETYLHAVEAAGGIPLLIYLSRDAAVLDAHYRRCDALLFAGGGDVDPRHFRAEPHPQLGSVDALRDEVELALARRAAADGLPMLVICRGVQVLNVALGGSLYQDIPAELPEALDHYASRHVPGRAHLAHAVALDPGSWLAGRIGAYELSVNTFHHQALRDLAPSLRIVGRAPDGVIEAVESTGPNFVVGVQCHPEELWDRADARWSQVFAGFIDIARQRALAPAYSRL